MSRHAELMQLHDDELSPERLAELERELGEEDLAVLSGLEQVGDVVRALAERDGAPGAAIADAVMARIDAGDAPKLGVVEGGAEAPLAAGPAESKSVQRLVVVAGAVLAAAAALVLWLRTSTEGPGPAPSVVSLTATVPAAPTQVVSEGAIAEVDEELEPAAAIEAVDFGSQPGSIFLVPTGAQTTPVVWLVDEPTGARMEPL